MGDRPAAYFIWMQIGADYLGTSFVKEARSRGKANADLEN
jgi:hypothetical protein